MNEEKNELINNLIDIEDEIQQLWDFHPDNPDAINVKARFIENQLQSLWEYHPDNSNRVDVEFEFQKLQREAASIQSFLEGDLNEMD